MFLQPTTTICQNHNHRLTPNNILAVRTVHLHNLVPIHPITMNRENRARKPINKVKVRYPVGPAHIHGFSHTSPRDLKPSSTPARHYKVSGACPIQRRTEQLPVNHNTNSSTPIPIFTHNPPTTLAGVVWLGVYYLHRPGCCLVMGSYSLMSMPIVLRLCTSTYVVVRAS
jgi:hypothetical protein